MPGKSPPEELKLKVVKAHEGGNCISHLVEVFGYHRNSIRNWIDQYEASGNFSRKKEPGSGRPPKLNCRTGKKLLKIIRNPASKYGFETDFWTTGRMMTVCKRELGINLSRMALHRTMQKFEYSYKKPQKRYYEANIEMQEDWKNTVVRKIKRLVKKKGAILYFEDESNISLSPVLAKTWGPIGKRIKQDVTGNRGSVSAISAISNDGRLVFNLHDQGKRFNSDDIIGFLDDLLKHHKRRHLVVVMDRAGCHTSKKVQKFIDYQKRLNVFFCHQGPPN